MPEISELVIVGLVQNFALIYLTNFVTPKFFAAVLPKAVVNWSKKFHGQIQIAEIRRNKLILKSSSTSILLKIK